MTQKIAQAMKEWKAGGKQHKNPFLLKSIYNGWNREKAVHSYNARTSTYVQVSSLSPTANLTHFEVSMRNKWGWECDAACALSPSLHGGVCACDGSLKQYYTRRLILSERWHPVQIQSLQTFHRFQNHINRWDSSAEYRLTLPPSTHVIKSLSALPSVGVSVSCRHAVSHFRPAMMIFWAGLTPVVIRLPAVYPLTPLRSKISLCSVSVREAKKHCSTGRW